MKRNINFYSTCLKACKNNKTTQQKDMLLSEFTLNSTESLIISSDTANSWLVILSFCFRVNTTILRMFSTVRCMAKERQGDICMVRQIGLQTYTVDNAKYTSSDFFSLQRIKAKTHQHLRVNIISIYNKYSSVNCKVHFQ